MQSKLIGVVVLSNIIGVPVQGPSVNLCYIHSWLLVGDICFTHLFAQKWKKWEAKVGITFLFPALWIKSGCDLKPDVRTHLNAHVCAICALFGQHSQTYLPTYGTGSSWLPHTKLHGFNATSLCVNMSIEPIQPLISATTCVCDGVAVVWQCWPKETRVSVCTDFS